MPVRLVSTPEGPAYRWGESGALYRFDPDDPASRREARRRAARQGRAIRAAGYVADARIPKRAPPRLQAAVSHEREYHRRAGPILRWLRRELEAAIRRAGLTRDAADADEVPPRQRALTALAIVAERVRLGEIPSVEWGDLPDRIVKRSVREIEALRRAALGEGLPAIDLRGAALDPLVEAWVVENTRRVSTLTGDAVVRLQGVLTDRLTDGSRVETVAARIAEQFGVSDRHARLLARDQCGKLNARAAEEAAAASGSVGYTWITSDDESVRPLHDELGGTFHTWDNPPVSSENGERGHPGIPIQCRCVAIPAWEEGDRVEQPRNTEARRERLRELGRLTE